MSYKLVLEAKNRLAGYLHKTPVFTSQTVDKLTGRKVYFKAENLQKTGTFKPRGALNAVLHLKETDEALFKKGVVTHSSGNHGQALAWAAQITGIPCTVVCPNNTPIVKTDAIRAYGANLLFCEPNPQARESTCLRVSQEKGMTIIPPYDHIDMICGEGTLGIEFLEQVPELDAIFVATSGGGMVSGIAIAAKDTKIFAVEPEGKDLERSLKAGERLWEGPPKFVDTIAESIRTQQPGFLNFDIMTRLVQKEVFTVTDQEMIDSMKFVWRTLKLVVEAAAAAPVAAVMSEKMKSLDPNIQHVGVILCGGNVDLDSLPWYPKKTDPT